MADLSFTAGDVVKGAGTPTLQRGIAGATITAGQAVRLNPATAKFDLADRTTAALAVVAGLALHGASLDQPITVLVDGKITLGGGVTVGEIYVASANAGGIAAEADLASGAFVTVIAVGTSSTELEVRIHASGVAVP